VNWMTFLRKDDEVFGFNINFLQKEKLEKTLDTDFSRTKKDYFCKRMSRLLLQI
jgi:hypothetical protein